MHTRSLLKGFVHTPVPIIAINADTSFETAAATAVDDFLASAHLDSRC